MSEQNQNTVSHAWLCLFGAWIVAAVSTMGALFLGEIMGYTPCLLCWYQRIAMFPLSIILAIALFPLDVKVVRYALPLAAIGLLLALFHEAMIAGWIPEQLKPCEMGVPCGKVSVEWFGFLTIPHLSVMAFVVIIFLLSRAYSKGRT